MLPPTLQAALSLSLETAINQALQYDPSTRLKLAALAGQSLAIDLTQPVELSVLFTFSESGVLVSHNSETATTRLRGSLAAFSRLAVEQKPTFSGSGIQISGPVDLVVELQSIVQQLDIDWEDAINPLLGDIASHQLGQLVRSSSQWGQQQRQHWHRLLQEFLTEELQALPTRGQLVSFYQEVDDLRLATDRSAARLRRLQQHLQQHLQQQRASRPDSR